MFAIPIATTYTGNMKLQRWKSDTDIRVSFNLLELAGTIRILKAALNDAGARREESANLHLLDDLLKLEDAISRPEIRPTK